jgi:hypothetical protein
MGTAFRRMQEDAKIILLDENPHHRDVCRMRRINTPPAHLYRKT